MSFEVWPSSFRSNSRAKASPSARGGKLRARIPATHRAAHCQSVRKHAGRVRAPLLPWRQRPRAIPRACRKPPAYAIGGAARCPESVCTIVVAAANGENVPCDFDGALLCLPLYLLDAGAGVESLLTCQMSPKNFARRPAQESQSNSR